MEKVAQFLWGTPTVLLLTLAGVLMTWRTGFVQVRQFPAAVRQLGRSLRSEDRSAFRAVCTALAATVGTGNIAGVVGAITLGGPGAVFWMWVAAFLGMATKYAEVVLAVRYRTADGKGGPMYYIKQGMGRRYHWLASAFAFCAVLASFGMGNMAQINTISQVVQAALPEAAPGVISLIVGLAGAVLVGAVVLGSGKRLGSITEKLVPLMAGMYIVSMVAVIGVNWRNVGSVLRMIFVGAFSPKAVLGAGCGIGISHAVRCGVSRGVFSNEAGLGSSPIAHAGSALSGQEQGLLGIFEVFFDTIVLCTLTAFAVLTSGLEIPYGTAAGAELATQALQHVWGGAAPWLNAAVLTLLALATMISWHLYGARCAEFLWDEAGVRCYSLCYVFLIVLGATMNLSGAWAFADICNALMCIPNLTALVALQKQVKSAC